MRFRLYYGLAGTLTALWVMRFSLLEYWIGDPYGYSALLEGTRYPIDNLVKGK